MTASGYRWARLTWPAAVVALGLGFALVPLARGELFFYWDNAQQHYPQTVFLHEALRGGEFPQWWPAVGGGVPTLAEGQAAHLHPVRVLLAALCPPAAALMLEIGLAFALAGLGTFLFLRSFRSSLAPCAVGAIGHMFGSFSVVFVRNMALHRSMSLLPWAFWCAERFARRGTVPSGLLVSVVIGLQLLSGHPVFAVVTMVTTTAYVVGRSLQASTHADEAVGRAGRALLGRVGRWVVFLGLGVCLGAIQLLPTLIHATESVRAGGFRFAYATRALAADVASLPQLLLPYAYEQGDWLREPSAWGNPVNPVPSSGVYVGALLALLSGYALWWRRRWPDPGWVLAACGLLALALSLGGATPLYPALWSMPGLSGLRFPSRFLLPVSFAIACLGALGFHHLRAHARLRTLMVRDYCPVAVPIATAGVVAVFFWLTRPEQHDGIVLSAVVMVAALAVVVAVGRRGRHQVIVPMVVLGCAVGDLAVFRARAGYAPTIAVTEALAPPAIATRLQADGDRFRTLSLIPLEEGHNRNAELRDLLQADLASVWGIESADVWFSLFPKRPYAVRESLVWELLHRPESAKHVASYLGALNVKYLVAPRTVDLSGWVRVASFARATLWQNPAFLPRAFLVADTRAEPQGVRPEWVAAAGRRLTQYQEMVADWWSRLGEAQIIDHVLADAIDFRTTAVVAGATMRLPSLDPHAGVQADFAPADRMRFVVRTATAAFLVIAVNQAPGWSATLDGRPIPIQRTNWLHMGVLVPAGGGEVELRYTTPGLWLGGLITGAAALVLVIGLAGARLRVAAGAWRRGLAPIAQPIAARTGTLNTGDRHSA